MIDNRLPVLDRTGGAFSSCMTVVRLHMHPQPVGHWDISANQGIIWLTRNANNVSSNNKRKSNHTKLFDFTYHGRRDRKIYTLWTNLAQHLCIQSTERHIAYNTGKYLSLDLHPGCTVGNKVKTFLCFLEVQTSSLLHFRCLMHFRSNVCSVQHELLACPSCIVFDYRNECIDHTDASHQEGVNQKGEVDRACEIEGHWLLLQAFEHPHSSRRTEGYWGWDHDPLRYRWYYATHQSHRRWFPLCCRWFQQSSATPVPSRAVQARQKFLHYDDIFLFFAAGN